MIGLTMYTAWIKTIKGLVLEWTYQIADVFEQLRPVYTGFVELASEWAYKAADMSQQLLQTYIGIIGDEGYWLVGFVALLLAVELINMPLGHALSVAFGIFPRTAGGLIGIVLSPVLHYSPGHALSNTQYLLVLGTIVALQDPGNLLFVSMVIILLGGVGEWLLARGNNSHAGASGLVYGYLGYILVRGFQDGVSLSLLVAIGVFLLYGNWLSGTLPLKSNREISWEGHLFGAAAGAVAALPISNDTLVWGQRNIGTIIEQLLS